MVLPEGSHDEAVFRRKSVRRGYLQVGSPGSRTMETAV